MFCVSKNKSLKFINYCSTHDNIMDDLDRIRFSTSEHSKLPIKLPDLRIIKTQQMADDVS